MLRVNHLPNLNPRLGCACVYSGLMYTHAQVGLTQMHHRREDMTMTTENRPCRYPRNGSPCGRCGNCLPCLIPGVWNGNPIRCRRQCSNCIRLRAIAWENRAAWEFRSSVTTYWVTLTYRDSPDPETPTYVPDWAKDVRSFLRTIRKTDETIRYLATEERGEATDRLHWHLLLHVNDARVTRAFVESCWKHGHVRIRTAFTHRFASYMAKYQGKSGKLRASPRYGLAKTFNSESGLPDRIETKSEAENVKHLRACASAVSKALRDNKKPQPPREFAEFYRHGRLKAKSEIMRESRPLDYE